MTQWIEPISFNTPNSMPDMHPLVIQTLIRRGITSADVVNAFLDPDTYTPSPATGIPGLSSAVERVIAAIHRNESICIWGDFDVDGQTATTVLFSTLNAFGANVTYHIPVRANETHGVNIPILTKIIDQGANLILTCDTGITAHEAVDYARTRGVDIVITDHHELTPELPNAVAIVNPKLLPIGHPLATLSGVGVAYKLAEGLIESQMPGVDAKRDSRFSILDLLDLVALGLIADLAILKDDARYLVQKGLAVLRNTRRIGLQIMMEMAELNPDHLTEEHISFVLGPRLNAIGRLGDANLIVELLTTSDSARARVLATQLEGLNAQRQFLCSQVTQAAEAQLCADPSLLTQSVLVLWNPSWPAGVVGIAASRLVERYRKPAILFSTSANEPAHGSARSVEGLNITAAIATLKDLLLGFGGHPMAAGLSLEADKLPEFRRRLAINVEKMFGETMRKEPKLEINCWIGLADVTLDLADVLEQLSPFGPGNEKLTLATSNLKLQTVTAIGLNKEHLKLNVADEAGNVHMILWWNGLNEPLPEGKFDLAYTLRASDWRGTRQVQMEFVDFRLAEDKPIEVRIPVVEILDYRHADNALELLKSLPAGTVVWAEGKDKKQIGGLDRYGLMKSEALAIWTMPPGPEELHLVLEKVKPQRVFLFASNPGLDDLESFLERLAGLVKFIISRHGGRTSYTELAAATAQKETAVRKGIGWLAKSGNVKVENESKSGIILTLGVGESPEVHQEEIESLLVETTAYRTYFQKADSKSLIGQ